MKGIAVKTFVSLLVITMIVWHVCQGHLQVSTLCFLHVVCGLAVLYSFYENHPIQKKVAKFWIGATSLFPFVFILGSLYQILFGNEKPWQYDCDSWASICILSVPLFIGVVAYILVSMYLKENEVQEFV